MLTARLHIVTRCLDGLSRARLAPIYVSIPSFRPLKSIIGGPGLRVVLGYLHAVPAKCSPSQHRRPRNEVLALSCEDVQRPPRILEKGGTYAWWGWGGAQPGRQSRPAGRNLSRCDVFQMFTRPRNWTVNGLFNKRCGSVSQQDILGQTDGAPHLWELPPNERGSVRETPGRALVGDPSCRWGATLRP